MTKIEKLKLSGFLVVAYTAAGVGFIQGVGAIYDIKTNQLPSLPVAKKDIGNAVCENKGQSGLVRIVEKSQQYKFVCGS